MKPITTTKGQILAVKVPEGAYDFHIGKNCIHFRLPDGRLSLNEDFLPKGNWQIINTWSKLTFPELIKIGLTWDGLKYLMHANGMYLVNPMGPLDTLCGKTCHCTNKCLGVSGWQKYQEATGEYLILFKPNK